MICGAYGRGNAGDDAILLAILTELRSIDPDLSFQVFSRSPMDTRRTYRVNAFYTFNGFQAIRYFRKAKFFINGGGSLMQDVTSRTAPSGSISGPSGSGEETPLPRHHVRLRHRPHPEQTATAAAPPR